MPDPVKEYLKKVEKELQSGDTTEHSHRPHLKTLIESFDKSILAINEPKRVKCGAPDFIVLKGQTPLGYMEAKDIGIQLSNEENSEQLTRYRSSLSNLILTDYLEFRWYVNGERRLTARIGETSLKRVKADGDGIKKFLEMVNSFLTVQVPTVGSPKELAQRMAALARVIRETIQKALNDEDKGGMLRYQMEGFREVLLHDLAEEQFADMYAQSICYGLFAARCNSDPSIRFTREHAAYDLPKTNPFLRRMFSHIAGPDLDDRVVWIVDDLAELLYHADMDSILQDFGKRTEQEDPVIHYYETFLRAYDPHLRETRGVYYTPEPVVSYIVNSVDQILKRDFALEAGLADHSKIEVEHPDTKSKKIYHRVQILDPAAGTGKFLYSIISKIRQCFHHNIGMWSSYVKEHLLPRVYGFELLMAPYAVAHMNLGLLLKQTGYDFASDDRLRIYLTNTLEGILADSKRDSEAIGFNRWLVEEASAAHMAKEKVPVMVILGNPPYSNFGQFNRNPWILDKLEDYKTGLKEKKVNLDDDFIKFIRFGQWRIDRTGSGILAFVTNRTYIEAITHRRMRESLMETFSDIYILDLHGGARQKERTPAGAKDENIFQIQQGVAISLLVKKVGSEAPARVNYAEMWGPRKSKKGEMGKRERLMATDVTTTCWKELPGVNKQTCLGSFFFWTPRSFDNVEEYCCGWSISDIFPTGQSGLSTDRDGLFFDFDGTELEKRMKTFYSDSGLEPAFGNKYGIRDSSSYDILARRAKTTFDKNNIHECLYRPFDTRMIYYSRGITSRPAWEIMQHVLEHGDNISLLSCRQQISPGFRHVFCSRQLVQREVVSLTTRERSYVFPLYLYPPRKFERYNRNLRRQYLLKWLEGSERILSKQKNATVEKDQMQDAFKEMFREDLFRFPNLHPIFVHELAHGLNLDFKPNDSGNLETCLGPDDIFHYIYSVLHSRLYRWRYEELLQIGFPRIPLTSNLDLFRQFCEFGKHLVRIHLMEVVGQNRITFEAKGDHLVDKVRYSEPGQGDGEGRVWINKKQYFKGVPPEVWNFHVGGYQVCEKWLKDRKGRKLSFDDLTHYQKIVSALAETIRIMGEIDTVIEDHGGFPIQ